MSNVDDEYPEFDDSELGDLDAGEPEPSDEAFQFDEPGALPELDPTEDMLQPDGETVETEAADALIPPDEEGGEAGLDDLAPVEEGGEAGLDDLASVEEGGEAGLDDLAPAEEGGEAGLDDLAPVEVETDDQEGEPDQEDKEEDKKEGKRKGKRKEKKEKGPGLLARLAKTSPYVVLLGISLLAIMIGILYLWMELRRYDSQIKPPQVGAVVELQSGPPSATATA